MHDLFVQFRQKFSRKTETCIYIIIFEVEKRLNIDIDC